MRSPAQEAAWTSRLWVYDLRTNMHFTLKTNPLKRQDLDEFVACFNPQNRHARQETWSEQQQEGRWRSFSYEELLKRDKLNLDIFWLRDKSLEDSENLPEPDVLAQEIIDDLEDALAQLRSVANEL
jgi:type I restriction enzyme M protein